jgi:hypothetical protein
MAQTSWGSRATAEPQDRTESRAAGYGPNDQLRSDNGVVLSSADNGTSAAKVAVWRVKYKKFV